jgi:hypothetical protein
MPIVEPVVYEERMYIDGDTLVLENPASTDRVRAKHCAFQEFFSVGTRYTETTLTGYWRAIDERQTFILEPHDAVRYICEVHKRGLLARWPDGTERVVRAVANRPQAVLYRVAAPEAQLHEHYSFGTVYRELAGTCRVCKIDRDHVDDE